MASIHSAVVPTSAISFVTTAHGRLRRQQRDIDKKDLKAARKHGKATPGKWPHHGQPTTVYYYEGITYIVNNVTGEEVTSYANPLPLKQVKINKTLLLQEEEALRLWESRGDDTSWWLSNTVLVVDTSGSMRNSDVWGCQSRLHASWFALALDFVAHRIETGAGGPKDIVSVVTLCEHPQVIIRERQCTWKLYNDLANIYSYNRIPSRGHGPYLPCFRLVKELLDRNANTGCPLAVNFLSDGVPSDGGVDIQKRIAQEVGALASNYGRLLTFSTVGIGNPHQFSTLRAMVDAAKDFGAHGLFQVPSMTSSGISASFTSVAKSLTSTQSEITEMDTSQQHKVRRVTRESRTKASVHLSQVSLEEFHVYGPAAVTRMVYEEADECRLARFARAPLQHCDAFSVALAKGSFGEGAERFAFRFYELAADGRTIVGRPLVAKESRLIYNETEANETSRREYARTFCKTQQIARQLAIDFNAKLDQTRRVHERTPRISLLDCSIYKLVDDGYGTGSVLVEERLEGKWQKWNANNGFVEGMKEAPQHCGDTIRKAVSRLAQMDHLADITEGSDDEEDSDSEHKGAASRFEQQPIEFSPFEVAQAFSHYTYHATRRKRLVCDLQGVYDEKSRLLRLSDPVIHYHNALATDRKNVHGRTDRGRKGMAVFFDSHHEFCGHLCKLVIRGFRTYRSDRRGPPRSLPKYEYVVG
jgi:Alpha-kinase family/von Willebrand factor type A domain